MKILASSLAMRFYKHYGWSAEILQSCLAKGSTLRYFNDPDAPYWILQGHSRFILPRLKPHVTSIETFEGTVLEPDQWDAFMAEMNW